MPGGGLPTFQPRLHGTARCRLSFLRQNHRRHALWQHLFGQKENQFQPGPRRARRRHQRSARRHLAGQFYGLRSRLHRSRGKDSATLKQPFWPKGVKYVFGTFCKASLRSVHTGFMERAMGIEPTSEAWEASILPLYDARPSDKGSKSPVHGQARDRNSRIAQAHPSCRLGSICRAFY
jgi:hypothetical protein